MGLNQNITGILASASNEAEGVGWNIFYYTAIVVVIVLVFTYLARKGITKRIFIGLPARLAEHLFLFIEGLALNVIGPQGRKYVPFLLAIWLFIFPANLLGQILQYTPTAEWSLNLSMSIITVLYVQYEGIKVNGIFGHFKHFAGPKLFGLLTVVSGLIFCVEIVSEMMKLFSLSLRLYGNIEGGHIVKNSLDMIVPWLPFGGFLLPIKLFTCVIQAYVFTILTCVYLSAVTSHEDEEGIQGHEATAH